MGKTKDFLSSFWQNIFSNATWEWFIKPLLSFAFTWLISQAKPLEWVNSMESVFYSIPVYLLIGVGIWTILSKIKQLFSNVFSKKRPASTGNNIKNLQKRLHSLTNDEKEILRYFIKNQTRTQYLSVFDGVVNGLELENIIFRASQMGHLEEWAYNIQPWAWDYLNKHPELLTLKKIEFLDAENLRENE